MTPKPKRVAIYTRVSTDNQTTVTQRQELEAWAERAGHTVVKVYEDQGISGAKGRDQRPQFDALLKAAIRRDFNMIAVWSSDRLGRSLKHLVEVLEIMDGEGDIDGCLLTLEGFGFHVADVGVAIGDDGCDVG